MAIQVHAHQTATTKFSAIILHTIVVLNLATIWETPRLIVQTQETGEFELMRINDDFIGSDSDHLRKSMKIGLVWEELNLMWR